MSNRLKINTPKSLIGGIQVTPEEKEQNLNKIKEATIINNQGEEPIKFNHKVFAECYPESLELVKEYYDSLCHARIANITGWNGEKYIDRKKKIASCVHQTKRDMLATLMVFAPDLINKEIVEIKHEFRLSTNDIYSIFDGYKKNVTNASITKNSDESNYQATKQALKELILKIGTYRKNGIKVNSYDGTINMPFTILDYYTLTNYSPATIMFFLNNPNNFKADNQDEELIKSYAKTFLRDNKSVGIYATKELILNKHMAAGKPNHIVQMNEEIYNTIVNLFEKEGIPNYKQLFEKAFQRYALNQPILPIRLIDKTMILTEEKENESHLTKTLKP